MSPLREDPVDWVLVHRYVAGECTPDERARLETWMQGSLDRQTIVESAALAARAWEQASPAGDSKAAWGEMREKMGVSAPVRAATERLVPLARHRQHVRSLGWVTLGLGIAAAVLLAVGVSVGRGPMRYNAIVPVPGRAYVTAPGQRLGVTLDDGTIFTLAPGSRLQLGADFGRNQRDVTLQGEAYFVVKHDASHPFAVHTSQAVITDVGTKFDVQAYEADPARVVVAEGAVNVGAAFLPPGKRVGAHGAVRNDAPTLYAGDMATVTDSGVQVAHDVDLANVAAWIQGGLNFDATPLREAVKDISRTYGVRVTIADTTLQIKRVTGSFSNESVDEVLSTVTQAVGAEYQRVGQTIVIRRARAQVHRPAASVRPIVNMARTE